MNKNVKRRQIDKWLFLHTRLKLHEFKEILGYDKFEKNTLIFDLISRINVDTFPSKVFYKRFDLLVIFKNNPDIQDGVYHNMLCLQTGHIVLQELNTQKRYEFKIDDTIENIDEYLKILFHKIEFFPIENKRAEKYLKSKRTFQAHNFSIQAQFDNNVKDNSSYLNGFNGYHVFREIDTSKFMSVPLFDNQDDESFS